MNLKHFLTLAALAATFTLSAQKGFLRGNIEDGDFGGPLIGAAIQVVELPNTGTATDFDGNYSLTLPPGTYTVTMSFVSFTTLTYKEVVIKDGETTVLDAVMRPASEQLAEVQVVASVKRNTEAGLLIKMKNSPNVVDGLSTQTFRKVGDGDASAAIKRVTGVTVEGGKYVYVRGLGDRYTKTTLNGLVIPGLDPDVNAVQIDIFPTSILENISVYKTFTPDEYGDFSGGLVDVVTKSFPEQKTTSFSIGLEYVPGQTLNPDFFLYDGGNTDFLGFDDGTRKLPFAADTRIPQEPELNSSLETYTRAFNPQLATQAKTAFPNGSFSVNHGNQITRKNGASFGYNMVLNYSNSYYFYKDFETNRYLKDNDLSVNELFQDENRLGDVAGNNVQWSTMLSGAYKKGTNSYNLMFLHSQSGEATAAERLSTNYNQTGAILLEDILTYTQRSLSTVMAGSKHMVGKLQVEWSNAFTLSRVYDPDFRTTSLSITSGDTTLVAGDGAQITRFWRDLNEVNENIRVDVRYPLTKKIELRAGANGLLKWRDFQTLSYNIDRRDRADIVGDPDWFLQEDNIWTPSDRSGTFTIGNAEPANNFDARQNVLAGYLMAEQSLFTRLKLIYGLRLEKATMFYTGVNNLGTVEYNDEKTLDETNLLPSLNIVYSLNESMNLRLSGSQTIARPSFKEKSIAQIYDPISKRTFVGNLDLTQTVVANFDLRYEWFMSPNELLSVTGFYKTFDGHIELVAFEADPDNMKPRNSGSAYVYGAEVELRKGFVNSANPFLRRIFVGGNVTLVKSAVDMRSVFTGNEGQTEYDLRERNLREGETLDFFRPMAGQSPYALNANLSYEIPEKEMAVSLAYNVKGEQLSIIASGRTPDVYTIPFHSLDFNAYYSFGKERSSRITLGIGNIMDDDRTLVYRSYEAEDAVFSTYKPGRTFKLKYSYSF